MFEPIKAGCRYFQLDIYIFHWYLNYENYIKRRKNMLKKPIQSCTKDYFWTSFSLKSQNKHHLSRESSLTFIFMSIINLTRRSYLHDTIYANLGVFRDVITAYTETQIPRRVVKNARISLWQFGFLWKIFFLLHTPTQKI